METPRNAIFFFGAISWAGVGFAAEFVHESEKMRSIASQESSAPEVQHAIPREKLVEALRGGGYVIYFRHTATDFSKSDVNMKSYGDCSNQRLLSNVGREAARNIGKHVKALGLPLGEVIASPYCRTLETAQLAFLHVVPKAEIREIGSDGYAGLKRLLSAPVAKGTNRWIVGHGIPFRAIAGPPHLSEGEAAVIEPQGSGWRVKARILDNEWKTLSETR